MSFSLTCIEDELEIPSTNFIQNLPLKAIPQRNTIPKNPMINPPVSPKTAWNPPLNPENTGNPTAPITRAEFATIIVRYLNITSKTDVNYIDIEDGYWAKDVIEKVSTSGLMNGYEDDTFKP